MRKNFVLDTNVLLHDPHSMFRFADNVVVIPITVLEEVDQFKKELSDRGRSAREVSRRLDDLRAKGHLSTGIALKDGGELRVALSVAEVPVALRQATSADNRILGTALQIRDSSDKKTILVTKDVNLRIRADALGLTAQDYDVQRLSIDEVYSGNLVRGVSDVGS